VQEEEKHDKNYCELWPFGQKTKKKIGYAEIWMRFEPLAWVIRFQTLRQSSRISKAEVSENSKTKNFPSGACCCRHENTGFSRKKLKMTNVGLNNSKLQNEPVTLI